MLWQKKSNYIFSYYDGNERLFFELLLGELFAECILMISSQIYSFFLSSHKINQYHMPSMTETYAFTTKYN